MSRILALFLVVGLTGCFGSMNATSRLRTWNREIENRWAGEGTYLLTMVTRVKTVVSLSDFLIFNPIEFWTGKHPIGPVSMERRMAVKELDAQRHGK